MTFNHTTEFILDRAHFQECFDETALVKTGVKPYAKAIFLLVLGLVTASFAQKYQSFALFIFVLSAVEASSVFFAKPWWVWRQQLSRAANSKVTLVIDDKGIATNSVNQKLEVSWLSVKTIEKTAQGIIVHHSNGRSYLSGQHLSDEALVFIKQQVKKVSKR